MEVTKKQYSAITEQCRSLFKNKMTDYGAAWRILRLPSLTDQIFIKAQRIRSLQTNKEQKVAKLKIYLKDDLHSEYDLFASEKVKKVNILSRLFRSLNYLVWGDV